MGGVDVVDVVGVELVVGESLEDGAVVGQRVDGLEWSGAWVVQSPEGGEPDGVGEVIEGDALAVELRGDA